MPDRMHSHNQMGTTFVDTNHLSLFHLFLYVTSIHLATRHSPPTTAPNGIAIPRYCTFFVIDPDNDDDDDDEINDTLLLGSGR